MLFAIAATLLAAGPARAGFGAHGGGAVECAGHLSFLDFFEARKSGLTVPTSHEPVRAQVLRAIRRLKVINPEFGERVAAAFGVAERIQRALPVDQAMTPPVDTDLKAIPRGCHLLGVAEWQDEGENSDAHEMLTLDQVTLQDLERVSPTEAAGVWVHEAVFKVLRRRLSDLVRFEPDMPSTRARQIVGLLFSTKQIEPVEAGLPSSNVWACRPGGDPGESFLTYIYPQDDNVVFQMVRIPSPGLYIFGKTSVTTHAPGFAAFLRGQTHPEGVSISEPDGPGHKYQAEDLTGFWAFISDAQAGTKRDGIMVFMSIHGRAGGIDRRECDKIR